MTDDLLLIAKYLFFYFNNDQSIIIVTDGHRKGSPVMTDFSELFNPLKVGSIELKNRFVMAPLTIGSTNKVPGAAFNAQGMEYFVRRARGGFGLIVTPALLADTKVDPFDPSSPHPLEDPIDFCKTAGELNRRAAAYGTKVFAQVTMGSGRNAPGSYAPSPINTFGSDQTAPALTKEQIKQKIDLFGQTAKLVKNAGFAGIEIHALHWGYLLDEFAMSLTNHRQDEYGGSLENRLRITKETIEAVWTACGPDFPISVRMGIKSFVRDLHHTSLDGKNEGGRTVEEAIQIAKLLEKYGVNMLDMDTGIYESFEFACPPIYMKPGFEVGLAAKVKAAVNIPVILGGRMGNPLVDLDAVKSNSVDGIALGRPAVADPDYPGKLAENKPESIRPCIGCNACLGQLFSGKEVTCTVNPSAGKGVAGQVNKVLVAKHIIVVGGGVAGMMAARTAALRGHQVDLYEAKDKLGGHLVSAGAEADKKEIAELNQWFQRELDLLGISVHLNTKLEADDIRKMNPDAVILGVGSKPIVPPFDGVDSAKVSTAVDVLTGVKKVGQHVVIIGGGQVGCELADGLLKQQKDVTIVEALPNILASGAPVPLPNQDYLRDSLSAENAKIMTSTKLVAINDQGALIEKSDGSQETLPADSVVLAIGFKPLPSMRSQLMGNGFDIFEIGDGNNVADINNAISQAFEVAREI